ncbi:hypothetical protein BVC80_1655g4 [Macleaya cordata]|uniref:Uncharacterized protein n=1 Tax=Macleaya cordata TaxID=56857 RepID=A0A200QIP2_MACCD|nr:hypothetical protein BVC80_1655g4 [Macleaya cordata]
MAGSIATRALQDLGGRERHEGRTPRPTSDEKGGSWSLNGMRRAIVSSFDKLFLSNTMTIFFTTTAMHLSVQDEKTLLRISFLLSLLTLSNSGRSVMQVLFSPISPPHLLSPLSPNALYSGRSVMQIPAFAAYKLSGIAKGFLSSHDSEVLEFSAKKPPFIDTKLLHYLQVVYILIQTEMMN